MDRATKPDLEARLVRYRELAHQYFDPVSVENMRLATAELEQQIRDYKEQTASVGGLARLDALER